MKRTLLRSGRLYLMLRRGRSRVLVAAKRLTGVHPSAYVHRTAHVARDLRAAPYVFVGRECEIGPGVTIDRYTMLAPRVSVVGLDHNWDQPGVPMQFTGRPPQRPTHIGADVWLGQGVLVMRGVDIGRGALVAAGAVVTHDVPAYEVWAGIPARKLRDRFPDPKARERHDSMLEGPLFAPRFNGPLGT